MLKFTTGNLLEADADALVNTVNTVGVMGKGIALMFKERFPKNFKEYEAACAKGQLKPGSIFVTRADELQGPQWIINFATKKHWRHPSKLEWISSGLKELKLFLISKQIRSVAIPPLGAGNGGLDWSAVRQLILDELSDLDDVHITVFEPSTQYQNISKRAGVEKLTPARALIAEVIRQYGVLGMECTLLEVQKLAWFLERAVEHLAPDNPLDLRFAANRYGPYADRLRHLLEGLDGSYLHCDRRIADAKPMDVIWFEPAKADYLAAYLRSDAVRPYLPALESTLNLIDGFESPFGMELLASIDWTLQQGAAPSTESVRRALALWPTDEDAGSRKLRIFNEQHINVALQRLSSFPAV